MAKTDKGQLSKPYISMNNLRSSRGNPENLELRTRLRRRANEAILLIRYTFIK